MNNINFIILDSGSNPEWRW